MSREFLGSGWQFPVGMNSRGEIERSSGVEDIEESIRLILGTRKGERVMRPEFGCGIHNYVFAAVGSTQVNLMVTSIREALGRWEPRIEVADVSASMRELDEGRILFTIDYRVRRTNTQYNLVYPFYIRE
jgi:phage baseplate assembly protein W